MDPYAVVIVDTETTGLGDEDEILQIAALCGDAAFNEYMLPTRPIQPEAAAVNGLEVHDGRLLHRGVEKECVPSEVAAKKFLAFLASLSPTGEPCLLVAHYAPFDSRMIVHWMRRVGLEHALHERVRGFVCSTLTARGLWRGKLTALAERHLAGPEWQAVIANAHSADADCRLVQGVLQSLDVDDDALRADADAGLAISLLNVV